MKSFGLALRFFLVIVLLISFPAGASWLLGGPIFATFVLGVCVSLILFVLFFSESIILKRLGSGVSTPMELSKTVSFTFKKWSHTREKHTRARILVYPDPVPNILTVRAWMGSGTVFLSQGLLSVLQEDEVRSSLLQALDELEKPGVVVSSASTVLGSILVHFVPQRWRVLIFQSSRLKKAHLADQALTPFSAIVFLIFFPFIWLFLRLARRAPIDLTRDLSLDSASHKIKKLWNPRIPSSLENLLLFQ